MIDINDAVDKTALTLSNLPLSTDEYLENIRIAATRLSNAGLFDMLYVTQYSSGATVWCMSRTCNHIMVYRNGNARL